MSDDAADAKPLTDAELETIAARADAATPGPWTTGSGNYGRDEVYGAGGKFVADCGFGTADADAAFIATARGAVPRLVADLRQARELLGHTYEMLLDSTGNRTFGGAALALMMGEIDSFLGPDNAEYRDNVSCGQAFDIGRGLP